MKIKIPIKLNTLRINTESNCYIFLDYGFVKNVNNVYHSLLNFFGKNNQDNYDKDGAMIKVKNKDMYICIILYRDCKNSIKNIFTQAHEETHALHAMGKIYLLKKKILDINPNFKFDKILPYEKCTIKEREYIANIGGFYALHKNHTTNNIVLNNNSTLEKAYSDYFKYFEES